MKHIKILAIGILTILSAAASAQEFATDKSAVIISGSGSFMSQGGDLFEDTEGNKLTNFSFDTGINYFLEKNLFLSANFGFSTQAQGDQSYHGVGLGPGIGYVFSNAASKVLPYVEVGFLYQSMNYDFGSGDNTQFTGSDIYYGFGLIVPIKDHLGLIIGSSYHMMNLNNKDLDDSFFGSTFSVSIGFAGLLF